jgi:hypothetical protein
MRQYATKHEFELGIDVTSTTRYVGYCKGGDFPWRIYAREDLLDRESMILLWTKYKAVPRTAHELNTKQFPENNVEFCSKYKAVPRTTI